VIRLVRRPGAAGPARRHLRPRRAAPRRPRRDGGAQPRRQDRGLGELPRRRALQPLALRQGDRAALGLPDAPGDHPVARPQLGAPHPGPLRTVRPRARAAPQGPDRLSGPVAPGVPALVARPPRRRGRGRHLRRPPVPGPVPRLAHTPLPRSRACSSMRRSRSRRGARRAGPAAVTTPHRPTPAQGAATPDARGPRRRSRDRVARASGGRSAAWTTVRVEGRMKSRRRPSAATKATGSSPSASGSGRYATKSGSEASTMATLARPAVSRRSAWTT